MNLIYPTEWEYFLAMEADLDRCSRFVEFSATNYRTYSIEFARLLLAVGSEIDVVAKMVCKLIDPAADPGNINEYRSCIISHYPKFADQGVLVPRYQLSYYPWKEWGTGKNPSWWRAYNEVKHERNNNFEQGNLSNVLAGFAGYYLLLGYLLFKRNPQARYDMSRYSRLFEKLPDPSDELIGGGGIIWFFTFPK